ncbi:MAG: 50S ribosomal protein L5 [Candidatus Diapherotrites archaeon]
MSAQENPMREIRISKVVVNMGVGESGEELEKAIKIMQQITGAKIVKTKAKVKLPTWDIRPGLEIGAKTTLRGARALEFLKNALAAKENTLSERNFDNCGNFGFGIREHIELPKTKYDPKLGIRGFDVLVCLERPGYRVKKRKHCRSMVGKKHCISRKEAIAFVKEKLGVSVN